MKRPPFRLLKYNLLFILAACIVVFSIMEPRFCTSANMLVVLRQAAVMGIFAIALTFVVVSGEFDISFAAIGGFVASLFSVFLLEGLGIHNMVIVWTIGWTFGIGVGLINASLVRLIGIPSFVATLGMMWLMDGASQGLTGGGFYFSSKWPKMYGVLGRGFTFGVLPNAAVFFIAVAIATLIILEHTRIGRHLHAVGDNPEASRHVGISISRQKYIAFAIAGFLAALGGTLTASQMGHVGPELTRGFLMPAITVVFLGSIFLGRRTPNIWGTLVAAILLAAISNGLTLLGITTGLRYSVQGALLLGSIAVGRKRIVAALVRGDRV